MRSRFTWCVVAACLTAGCEGATPTPSGAQASTVVPPTARTIAPPLPTSTIADSRRTAITTAVERVAPTVVTVQTETLQRVPVDFFEAFAGGRSGERRSAGIGSGFVFREDGVIVTAAIASGVWFRRDERPQMRGLLRASR